MQEKWGIGLTNEKRAELLIRRLGFDFAAIPKDEIRALIQEEIEHVQAGSSEYIRLLCGYLFCLGDAADAALLERVKHGISFDVECMIDQEWIDSLKNGGVEDGFVSPRETIIEHFVSYYENFEADDDEDGYEGSMFLSPLFDD